MDREKLIQHLEQRYTSKRDMISRIPLGIQPDALWQELQNRRRSKCTVLPLTSCKGTQYWYVITPKMVNASEKIVETLFANDTDFDPYTDTIPVATLEEIFYTSYVEGSQISIQAAMDFLTSESPPRDIEEQLITNNRLASSFARSNLYRNIDATLLQELSYILTDGMDNGGHSFRTDDLADFTSMSGELFDFPPPRDIPLRVAEITNFLASPSTHPLIKSAIAQAWMMLVRPFPEGNERLGRILSNMLLLRAGYTFFSDVSLSALIARKSYGYFESIENILREENGGDLTYFIEYFMELLSRAIDERSLRQYNQEEENRQAEIALAHTTLAQMQSEPPVKAPMPVERAPATTEQENAFTEFEESITTTEDTFQVDGTVSSQISEIDDSFYPSDEGSPMELLNTYATNPKKVIGQLSIYLLSMLEEGETTFSVSEVADSLQLIPKQLSSSLRYMKESGIIVFEGRRDKQTFYRITADELSELDQVKRNLDIAESQGISSDMISLINELLASSNSMKDRRLGTMIALYMFQGQITINDYRERGQETKWATDMALASQLGLVSKIGPHNYTILRDVQLGNPTLSKAQRRVMNEMYESFGESPFSSEMVVATLDYSDAHVSAYLHQFTLMKILDCHKEDVNKYQFIVSPEENPQLFEKIA